MSDPAGVPAATRRCYRHKELRDYSGETHAMEMELNPNSDLYFH